MLDWVTKDYPTLSINAFHWQRQEHKNKKIRQYKLIEYEERQGVYGHI